MRSDLSHKGRGDFEHLGHVVARTQIHPSCPDLIRASINLRSKPFSRKMDHRVKPSDDDLNWYDRHCEERILWFPSRRLLR